MLTTNINKIKLKMINAIIRLLPKVIINEIERPFKSLNMSYAQEGEDNILDRIFKGKQNGFYIDIGAHHPLRYSNTYKFYLKGWRGINIDAMPGSMLLFKKYRPEDLNLEIAISDKEERLTFYIFDEKGLNTLSEKMAQKRIKETKYKIIEKIDLQTKTLKYVLQKNLHDYQKIDFLSIDVEGLDYNVLKSNDWNRYKPEVILIENIESSIEKARYSEIYLFLINMKYEFYAMTYNTMIFKKLY